MYQGASDDFTGASQDLQLTLEADGTDFEAHAAYSRKLTALA